MTSKEAFEKMVELCNFYHHTIVKDTDIEFVCDYRIDNIRRDLEVLEILKKKNINIRALKSWNKTYKGKLTYQNYLDILDDCDLGEKLTQEEYDILKEVLL